MRRARRRVRGAGAAVVAALLPGCAAPKADVPPSPPRFEVLETLPAEGSVAARELCPLEPGERVVERVAVDDAGAGSDVGATEVHRIAATDRFGAEVSVEAGTARTAFHRPGADGGVVMPAVIDHDDRALTLFDPALVVAWDELAAGATRTATAAMRVLDAGNPKIERESGRATRAATYVDDQRIRTPLGVFVARRVEVRFTAELKLARAETLSTFWIAPDVGVVAEEHDERVRVLGIPAKRERTRLVLVR